MAKKKKNKGEKCLILNYTSLPEKVKKVLQEDYRFRNDVLIEYQSEFYTPGYEKIPWSKYLTIKELQRIHKNQVDKHEFEDSFKYFIKHCRMETDLWLIDEVKKKRIDLKGVTRILIDIRW